MMQIKRDDTIYLEIEQFENYELTNNLAFEMAVRNNTVMKDIIKIIRTDDWGYKTVLRNHGIIYPFIGLHLQKSLSLSDEQRDMLKNKEGRTTKAPPVYGAKRTTIESNNNSVKFTSAIDSGILDRVKVKDDVSDDELLKFLQKNFRDDISIEEFKTTYIDVESPPRALRRVIRDVDYREFLEVVLRYETPIRMKKREADIYASINTKRPLMMIEATAKIVTTSFNMALDIEELKAQIEIIKKEFDNNFNDIKSVAEHFNVELEKADRLICNSSGKCIDPRKVLTKQEKMADMLFIYDCMKENITKAKICRMMDDYYFDKKGKTTATDIKTVSEYQKIAIKHIDEMGYKELLTGVKNK